MKKINTIAIKKLVLENYLILGGISQAMSPAGCRSDNDIGVRISKETNISSTKNEKSTDSIQREFIRRDSSLHLGGYSRNICFQ